MKKKPEREGGKKKSVRGADEQRDLRCAPLPNRIEERVCSALVERENVELEGGAEGLGVFAGAQQAEEDVVGRHVRHDVVDALAGDHGAAGQGGCC